MLSTFTSKKTNLFFRFEFCKYFFGSSLSPQFVKEKDSINLALPINGIVSMLFLLSKLLFSAQDWLKLDWSFRELLRAKVHCLVIYFHQMYTLSNFYVSPIIHFPLRSFNTPSNHRSKAMNAINNSASHD